MEVGGSKRYFATFAMFVTKMVAGDSVISVLKWCLWRLVVAQGSQE